MKNEFDLWDIAAGTGLPTLLVDEGVFDYLDASNVLAIDETDTLYTASR